MKRKQLFVDVLITFFISIILGGILSLGTYFLTEEGGLNFKIGFPKTYYAQFYVDYNLHYWTDLNNFIFDGLVIWLLVVVIYFIKKLF